MKCIGEKIVFLILAAVLTPALGAQSLMGMSLNGASGLYTIPSARIGWDQNADVGLDIGYHAISSHSKMTHIPAIGVSLFRWLEISAAFDIQPEYFDNYVHNNDLLLGVKIQFPQSLIRGGTSLALGGNFQFHNLGDGSTQRPADKEWGSENLVLQIYGAVSYAGEFFNMPAETTVVLGKTFILHDAAYLNRDMDNKNIDFGMGFDLSLFPTVLRNYVHLIIDFSNYAYSALPYPNSAAYRGILNGGLRIDLSVIPPLRRLKFYVDILGTDLLDESRALAFGLVFGGSVK
ncbi:MAG: hypothetical protein LBT93_09385 [Treponema sp.]|jgi:hypothetical protein|nr:hypothetical protein [Treponema sp.]